MGSPYLASWAGTDSGFNRDLKATLTPREYGLLETEATAQQDRGAAAAKAIEALRAAYAAMDPNDEKTIRLVDDKTEEINLKYRRATLEARDRLLASLSLTGQAALTAWMNDGRSSITVMVPRNGLSRWRAPE